MSPATQLPFVAILLIIDAIATRFLVSTAALAREGLAAGPPAMQRKMDQFLVGMTALYMAVLICFWVGQNWARWVVLVASVLPLGNAFLVPKVRTSRLKLYLIFDAVLSAFVIMWLLQPATGRLFAG